MLYPERVEWEIVGVLRCKTRARPEAVLFQEKKRKKKVLITSQECYDSDNKVRLW